MANARDFPGTIGNSISVTTPTGILTNAAWTCLMWLNPDALTPYTIVRVGTEDNGPTRGVLLAMTASGFYLRVVNNAVSSPTPLAAATWQRVGFRKVSAGVSQMYVTLNGVDVGNANMDPPTDITTGDPFIAGGSNVGGLGLGYYNGRIAFLAWVQGAAISAASQDAYLQAPELLVTHFGPTGTILPNALKLYWPMQCDTATEEDRSGVGNNGTRSGTVPLDLSGPTPTTAWDPCASGGTPTGQPTMRRWGGVPHMLPIGRRGW